MAKTKGSNKADSASASAASPTSSSTSSIRSSSNARNKKDSLSSRLFFFLSLGAFISSSVYLFAFHDESATSSASVIQMSEGRYNVSCLEKYPSFGACSPPPSCARLLVDDFISPKEVAILRNMGALGMSFGEGSGGPTIFDVATGAASKGEAFVDAYNLLSRNHAKAIEIKEKHRVELDLSGEPAPDPATVIITQEQIDLYRRTMNRVKARLSEEFGVSNLYLTSPSFFSRITSKQAKTKHDEYWHSHIDKIQYGSFMYTALIYLSDYDTDFKGGEFSFVDNEGQSNESLMQALPAKGRLMAFTSGKENAHFVSKVTSGTRFALTIAFTCDKAKSVEANLLKKADELVQKQKAWEEKFHKAPEVAGLA